MVVLLILSVGLLVVDQVTKALVTHYLPVETDTLPILQDFFHFTHVRNSGAVFGIGGDHGWLLIVFILAAIGATVLFAVLFAKNDFKDKRTKWYALSLALLMAGTAGNMIDRMFQFDHQVVDFIDFRGIWPYVFNVADMCLCVGIALFLFDQLFLEPKRGRRPMAELEREEALEYLVTEADECVRVDKFVAKLYPQFSRTLVQKTIEASLLEVNGLCPKSNYVVQPGDLITILDVPLAEMDLSPEDIPLDIVYEDDDLLVVNKPSGMVVHPAPGAYEHTLVNALLFHVNALSSLNGKIRPGIIHRIDKDTSGLLMVAKNDRAHRVLAEELSQKKTEREYLALVDGVIPMEKGKIEMPIGRDPKDRKRMAVVEGGKTRLTHFSVVERFAKNTLVKCILETGRTHQIRVHLAKIGYPVANDPVYNKRPSLGTFGQYLHAATLGITHPTTGEFLRFSAPLPEDFAYHVDELRNLER